MFRLFLQIQHRLGRITDAQLRALVPDKIAAADFEEITGFAY